MLASILLLLPFLGGLLAEFYVHDDGFVPDYVLEATLETIQVNCKPRLSVLLNGTYPGPPLYLTEGEATWIRVYNRMTDRNVTVVSIPSSDTGHTD